MHSALETAAVVDIRTVLQQLGQQQLTAFCVMRVDLHQAKVTFQLQTALHATLVGMVRQARPHHSVQAHVRVDVTRLIPRARVLLRQTALSAMLVATVQRVGSRLHAVVTVG